PSPLPLPLLFFLLFFLLLVHFSPPSSFSTISCILTRITRCSSEQCLKDSRRRWTNSARSFNFLIQNQALLLILSLGPLSGEMSMLSIFFIYLFTDLILSDRPFSYYML